MKKALDLLLVNPGNRLEQYAKLNELATIGPPLGIAMLAAYVRQYGFSVVIIDAEAFFWTPEQTIEEIEKYEPVLVGLTTFTTKMTAAGKTLKLVKDRMPFVKTMIGGHHASAIPERTLRDEAADFVIQGEGYLPVVELLKKLKDKRDDFDVPGICYKKNNLVVSNGRAKGITRLDELPLAAWDILRILSKKHGKRSFIEAQTLMDTQFC